MNLDQIRLECFILALFIRDDGERFLLGSGAYEFMEDMLHFAGNSFENDIVEVQGNDGVMLAGQVRRASDQEFRGYIGDATTIKTKVEQYRRDFFKFFRKEHYYKVVYVLPDGTAIQRRQGFIVEAPEVKELYQVVPEYSVGFNFEDVNYYSYTEDSDGNETYAKSATLAVTIGAPTGGLLWDAEGVVWDSRGAIWENGGKQPSIILVESIEKVYPVWVVTGPISNPELTAEQTNTSIKYTGNILAGQTLVVDMAKQTALLNNASVVKNISGSWVSFVPGNNRVIYDASSPSAPDSTIYWQEIVG